MHRNLRLADARLLLPTCQQHFPAMLYSSVAQRGDGQYVPAAQLPTGLHLQLPVHLHPVTNSILRSAFTHLWEQDISGSLIAKTKVLFLREVMDSMHEPHHFPRVFTCSYLYVFTLTLPNAATVFAAFPAMSALQGKSLSLIL